MPVWEEKFTIQKKKLTIRVIIGTIVPIKYSKRLEGVGSNEQVEFE